MAQINFCGPSYTSQSTVADAERCLNLYPEAIESPGGKGPLALYPTPGLQLYASLTGAFVRGLISDNSLANTATTVAVTKGGNFFDITTPGSPVLNGTNVGDTVLPTDVSPVSMVAANGTILLASVGSLFTYTAGVLTNISAAVGGQQIYTVDYCDGFFLAQVANSNKILASAPLDPTTWPGTSFTAVSVFPGTVQRIIVNQRQIWMFGRQAAVVYYDSGNSPFPFDVISGSYMEAGTCAPHSVAKLDNSIFWLGFDPRGIGIVWRANGYTPQRISNHAVEFAIQGYSRISDAQAYTYQDQGHSFYVIYFPSANSGNGATWVYDVATNMWHERCFLNGTIEQAHRSNCHAQVSTNLSPTFESNFGTIHIVGDWASGNIYQMQIPTSNGSGGWNFATDFGNPIKRLRRAPVVNIEKEWMRYDELKLDMDTGLGPIPPLTGPSSSPSFIYLQDSSGVIWSVQINDLGTTYIRVSGAIGTPETIILNDNVTGTTSWLLSITTGGVIFATSVPFLNTYPQTFPMATQASLLQTGIQIGPGGTTFPIVPPFAATRDPQVMLRWSKDNANTWSNQQFMSAGAAGNYTQQVRMSRMGRARQMTFEASCADPIPWRFVNAYLKATAYQPEERLIRKLAKSA